MVGTELMASHTGGGKLLGMAGFFGTATLDRIRAASDIVDVIGAFCRSSARGRISWRSARFTRRRAQFQRQSAQANLSLLWLSQGRGCVHLRQGLREHSVSGRGAAAGGAREDSAGYRASPGAQEARHVKDTLLQIHEQITQRWQSALTNDAAGRSLATIWKRGVSQEAIKLFRFGYAPDLWDDTVNWAKSKSHDLALVEKAGLIIRKEGADHFYDRFRGRLMFPICDEQGRVIAFSGRVLSGDEKTAKYVNSPETPIFTKSKVFFGLDKSKRAVLDAGSALVCEGQLDLIACFMAGVQNVVAPQGTAFTEQHARIIKRYVDEVVLCFDSDNAGQSAAVRSLDSLLASGLAVRVAIVPAPHDPDSFIKEFGADAFRALVSKADGFFDYYLNRLCATNEITADKGRLTVLRGMAEAVQKTGNAVLIDKYAQKTALRLGVSPDSMRGEFKKIPASTFDAHSG